MRSALPTTMVLLAALMAACDRSGSPVAPKASAKPPVRKASATPATRGSLPPGASPVAVPSGPDTLFKPKEASVGLTGTIALDARYALEQKGTFISDQGGGLISDKGGSLISNNGGGLIANNGSNLIDRSGAGILSHHGAGLTGKVKFISDQGGGFISDQGGGFISDQGGGLISNNGGALISNNGGGVVANNGGGLISNNGGGLVSKTKFALLADAFDALLPGQGRALQAAEARHEAVPAGGMLVGVISLLDGAYLPLGVDRAGKAVYFVYTDAKGQFQVHLPAALAKRVLVVSSAPGSDDPRLAVDLVANADAKIAVQVDDSTTVVTAYLRQTVSARLVEALDPDPCKPEPRPGNTVAAIGFGLAVGVFEDVFDAEFKALPRAARLRVLARFAEVAIGNTDLQAVEIKPELAERSTVRGLAYPALVGILRDVEAAVAKKLEADPAYFDGAPYLAIANRERGSGPAFAIRKPADFTEFLVAAYLTSNDLNMMRRMEGPLVDLGLSPTLREEIQVAGGSMFAALVPGFSTPEGEDQMRRALKAAIATEKAGTPPPEPTCLPSEAPPTADAEVTTLAGGDEAAVQDGLAATARFKRPAGLAFDPRGFLLVADQDGARVRKIDLEDPTHPVTTVAGTGEEGWADGPGATAKLFKPVGLALDGKGALYVAERGNHRIRKITGFDGPNAMVSTVAGSGTAAWADGVGVAASFNEPGGLAFGPDGALYVADKLNHRVRKIAFEADGTARVSTFAGSGSKGFDNAVGEAARFADPRGLGFLPDGAMLVGDGGNDLVRIATPAAQVATYAGQVNEGGADGSFYTAQFDVPVAFAIDARGVAYVADALSHRIRRLTRDGRVTTIAGGGTTGKEGGGFADGVGAAARFDSPEGIAFGEGGALYVADAGNRRIRIVKPK